MKITAYNQHDVGSSHEPWSCSSHTTLLATSQRRYPIKRRIVRLRTILRSRGTCFLPAAIGSLRAFAFADPQNSRSFDSENGLASESALCAQDDTVKG